MEKEDGMVYYGYWSRKSRDEIWRQIEKQLFDTGKHSFNVYSFFTSEFRTNSHSDYMEFEKIFESIVNEHGYHVIAVQESYPPSYIIAPDRTGNHLQFHHLQ